MNKQQLIDAITSNHDNQGVSKTTVAWVVDTLAEKVTEQLKDGNEVTLHGLGKFKVSDRKARTGRNPATGAPIEIAASKQVGFSVFKQLKDAVNG